MEDEERDARPGMTPSQTAWSLAAEFGRRARATGIPGASKQEALRPFFRRALADGTPVEVLEAMVDQFFIGTPVPSDTPLWRQFLGGASRLHNVATQRASETTRAARRAVDTGPQISGNVPAYLRAALAAEGIEVG